MVEKQVSVRMVASGGRQVKAEFTEIGREGARAFDQVQRSSRASGAALQNVGFQVQDFAVQVESGTSVSRALGQQLPQLLSGFGLLGVALGTATAVFVPFIGMLFDSGDAAEDLEDTLKDLEQAAKAYSEAVKLAATPMVELEAQFGKNAAAVRELYEAQVKLAQLDMASAQARVTAGLRDQLSEVARLTEIMALPFQAAPMVQRDIANLTDSIRAQLGLTVDEAMALQSALDELGDARGPQAVFDAAVALQGALLAAADDAGKLPPEMEEAYRSAVSLQQAALAAGLEIDEAANAGGRLNDTNMSDGLRDALSVAQQLALATRKALFPAQGGRGDPRQFVDDPYWKDRFFPDPLRVPKARSGGGSGNDTLREAQRLYESTRTAAEKYEDEVARINALHREFAAIVTDEVRDRAIRKLQDDLLKTDAYAKQAASAIRSAFDGLFDDPIAALEQLGKQLLQMALYQQLASSLPNVFGVGGIIPLPSADGGGFTGFGPRMGGLDGKGGFLAMLHPRETVIDHTKPGGRPSGVNVVVHNYSGAPARTERSRGPDGRELVRVIVGEEIARGKLDRPMKGRFGAAPQPVKR